MAEFKIHTKTFLTDNIREIYWKLTINNYTNSSKIIVIIILITNLRSEISSNKDDFIPICRCQVSEFNSPHKDNINNVS